MEQPIKEITEVLRQAAHLLSGIMDEEQIIQTLLREVAAISSSQKGVLFLRSATRRGFVIGGSIGLSEAALEAIPLGMAEDDLNRRVTSGEVLVVEEIATEPGYAEVARIDDLHGAICIPLMVREHAIGILHSYCDVSDAITKSPGQHEFLKTVADLGALALERVRFHKSLFEIAKAMNSTVEIQPMLQMVLESAVGEMWLNAGSIRLLDTERGTLFMAASYGLSESYRNKGEIHLEKSDIDRRVMQGETVALFDVANEPGFEYPEEAVREGILSVLAVPLKLKDRALGVMRVYSVEPRHFGPVGVTFLESIADLVSLAIENAELYATLDARYKGLKVDLAEWRRFLALG